MCQSVKRYANPNNKYMKNYVKKSESSYLIYLDATHLYGWAMSQKLTVNGFMWYNYFLEFTKDFTKNYDGNRDVRYFLEEDVTYRKKFLGSCKDLPFKPERK